MSENDFIQNIVDATGWDTVDLCAIQVYNATFKVDFGPWKKGQTIHTLVVHFLEGKMTEYDEKAEIVKSINLSIKAQ